MKTITVHTRLITLLGYPLQQTFAPQMFNETFRKLDLDYLYFPVETENDNLETIIGAIRCMNFAGFNVTKPNKIKVIEYLDELDGLAEKIGSVNVVAVRDNRLIGYNTDGIGFVQSLHDEAGTDLSKTAFFVFGAGGASRAISSTLAFQGAKKIYIIDIIDSASLSLVNDINGKIRNCAEFVPFGKASVGDRLRECGVLVNASGIGMHPHVDESPLEKRYLFKDLFVCDCTYNPLKTRLLQDAEEVGCRTMNGVGMVINQGMKGFSIMTGLPEPVGIMKETMLELLGIGR